SRAVQPALERGALDLPLRQRDLTVGAHVVDRVVLAVLGAHERHLHERAVGTVELQPQGLTGLEVLARGDDLGRHASTSAPAVCMAISSSASIAASMRSPTTSTPIRPIISAKKPRSTSRRAASSGMPRARR